MKRGQQFATRIRLVLAARLGWDGNVLRRRSDRIAAWGAAALLAVFLVGAPLLSLAFGHWADRAAVTLCLAALARRVLDWRRLAAWETDWISVGPRWTRQFWAPG